MFKKFVAGVLVFILAVIVNSTNAQENPDPRDYDWLCQEIHDGILCYHVDDYGNTTMVIGVPAGYCPAPGLSDIGYIVPGDPDEVFMLHYMIPCEPANPPEIPDEVFELAEEIQVGEEISGVPFPWNNIEKQSDTSFTLYEDKGDGLIGWRKFEKDEKGNWVKVDMGETQIN